MIHEHGQLNRRALLRGALGTGVLLGSGLGVATVGAVTAPTAAAATGPTIASCATWGARQPTRNPTAVYSRPARILIHHTATDNVEDYSLAHAYEHARWIQDLHMDTNGWLDSGQHFTNSRGGYLMEGRHQSLAALRSGDHLIEGAHCPGQNRTAIGIENEGNYMEVEPPQALWDSLVAFCVYTCQQYDIPPTEIDGHRDYYDTLCPGDRLYALLPRLREEVAAALN
ncbi:peptidoglycan recognition protein family protein [Goodfellowiella coeruleoviolacea]|uniref:N-acetylmuramoyl-L-alanine amidase n=1 Tax=Goodfellowiella coeruleoviolacea TaxID=334858 RepID=A0AAE3KIN6_9PSEU|nr:peptidoglycan recognition family protein [Goodfellowiella coeruleoviolacea]MCP2168665.1 N-acetylmuramoyl-L-alanine amidase [Goodfellowiella coeruleoviolacea]